MRKEYWKSDCFDGDKIIITVASAGASFAMTATATAVKCHLFLNSESVFFILPIYAYTRISQWIVFNIFYSHPDVSMILFSFFHRPCVTIYSQCSEELNCKSMSQHKYNILFFHISTYDDRFHRRPWWKYIYISMIIIFLSVDMITILYIAL